MAEGPLEDLVFQTTGGFSPEFEAEASDPHGEPLEPFLYIRLNDGPGGAPGTLLYPNFPPVVSVMGGETVAECSPITRRREVEFGVVQGGANQIKVTNSRDWFAGYNLKDCWAAIYGQFRTLGHSSVFAQGKIKRRSFETDGTVMLEIQDSIMDAINFELQRDIQFQDTGWLSEMSIENKSSGSRSYDSDHLTDINPADYNDETFIVEFTTPTAFKVILEDGDDSQTGNISTNFDVDNVGGGTDVLRIGAAGWNSSTGAYAVGDRFVFYTAEARALSTLTPINMVIHLLDDIAGLTAYDVVTGAAHATARNDLANWASLAAEYEDHAVFGIRGFWRRGTPLTRMIQDALKVVHGSIFASQDGRIELWVLQVGSEVGLNLNGNPGAGRVDISAARAEDDERDAVTDVVFEYLTFDGEDAAHPASGPTNRPTKRSKTFSTGWQVRGVAARSSAEKYIVRFGEGIKRYELSTTLKGAAGEIGKAVLFSDAVIGATAVQSDITGVAVDLLANTAQVSAYSDPLSLSSFFQLDRSELDGTEGLI